MTDLKRYYTPNGTGAALHPCGMLYMVSEVDAKLATLTAERDALSARVAELEGLAWIDGIPPKPWSSEWFIAETVGGAKVALFPLPGEWSYDFKTADETYFCASRIKRWMQFPDSEYVSFAADRITDLTARADAAEAALDGAANHLENLLEVMAEPDRQLCCDGRECGCQGATVYMEAAHYALEELNAIRAMTPFDDLEGGAA